ncbi:MAG: small multi-drug export protein [Candidatus Altiarchaeota archaeon]
MMDITFVLLSYILGPIASVPYAIKFLNLGPVEIFLYLSFLYLAALPLIFKIFEFFRHKEIYEESIIRKICRVCDIKAKEEIEKVRKTGNVLIENFENKLGHLGFYVAISIFTFLFGIFLASILAYFLKIRKDRAMLCISIGALIGNFFWVLVITYSLPRLQSEFTLILFILAFLLYGKRREIEILRKVSGKLLHS